MPESLSECKREDVVGTWRIHSLPSLRFSEVCRAASLIISMSFSWSIIWTHSTWLSKASEQPLVASCSHLFRERLLKPLYFGDLGLEAFNLSVHVREPIQDPLILRHQLGALLRREASVYVWRIKWEDLPNTWSNIRHTVELEWTNGRPVTFFFFA